ncbi:MULTISPECIES: phosphate ABC transporter permease PstA [unclassified Brevibacterium]|uniref:phosphate ABC transporter permease PstA n=1 Tax=unclassified Brevibacterium TaxID=2614124 RepID=UPI0008A57E90|nr:MULTISPECIES: phosphate ABC transporter permease PstA [unclassified Brevibacterium]OFL68785.1 phosphate ABC transporter, permease protein PstA [Brevibacterium sp. HMSC063G07]OFS25550.1 phosphate ABC transporter, permease protein PstA [Brevibacterium sp. HMSC07C04]
MNTQTRTADKTRGASHLVTKRLPKRAPLYVAAGSIILAIVLTLVIAHGFNIPLAAFLAGVINLAVIVGWSWSVEGRRKAVDRAATTLVTSSFALALIPLISLLWMSIEKGGPVIVENSTLLSRSMEGMKGVYDKDFAAGQGDLLGGFYHAIIGTLLITLFAALISIPIGIMCAVYLVEYSGGKKAGALGRSITFFVDVMTGIPSIVAGLFAFSLFSTVIGLVAPDSLTAAKSGIAASVALSVLMIPVVVRNTEEILRLVPHDLREASYALGVPKWKTIVKIVLPTAISGILSGITIAIARVIGETAPIMVTAGFAASVNWNVFSGWMSTLPTFIYDSVTRPTAPGSAAIASVDRAWAAALVLIIIVMVLNLGARIMAKVLAPKAGR